MNSGLMTVHNNDPDISTDDPEDLCQYCSLLLSGNEGNKLHPTTTQVIAAQLDVVSNSHMFTKITMLTYIKPVKFNVQILNGSKASEKGFGLVIIKPQKQTSLYHSGHHIICHKTRKTRSSKLHSNITINSEV